MSNRPEFLYHITTEKKAKLYRHTGRIIAPVRGFTTIEGAMAWGLKIGGRSVILKVICDNPHKLPAHHNQFGTAWWNDGAVTEWSCVFNAKTEA